MMYACDCERKIRNFLRRHPPVVCIKLDKEYADKWFGKKGNPPLCDFQRISFSKQILL